MSSSQPVNIKLLDREYTVGCGPDEQESLLSAARMLDSKMREIRGSNRMAALDRVAVLAALNLAHELQMLRQASEASDRELNDALGKLHRRLDALIDAPPR
ncbi:MAG: cell division protein ZapA [Lysobacter sp.]|nr:cell division protein ZapA [Lysobacter sp.]MDQ3205954.1 cell division protein ZapA [Pseudomonadota bacterium]